MARLSESLAFIPLCEPKDYGSAGVDFDGVNLGLMNAFSADITFGAITGNSILKVYAGATAAKTTAIAYSYRFGQADFKAALADTLGDQVAVASTGLTLTAATFDHRHITIDIDPDTLPSAKPWITFEIDSTATVMLVGAIGIARPRYPSHGTATLI